MAYRPLTDIPISLLTNSSTMASGYVLRAYLTGTTTPATLYSDADGTTAGTSITLDARGEPTTIKRIWLDTSINYKLVLETDAGATVWTADPVYGSLSVSDVFVQAGNDAVARTTQAKLRESVSVKDYGAVGDGATDDTAAIQAAIDYVSAGTYSGTVKLIFPNGIYLISRPLMLGGDALYIDGQNCTIRKTTNDLPATTYPDISTDIPGGSVNPNQNAVFITTTRMRFSVIENFNLEGENGVSTPIGIWAVGNENILRNIYVRYCSVGIHIPSMWMTKLEHVVVRAPTSHGIWWDRARVGGGTGQSGTSVHFDNCAVFSPGGKGFYLQDCDYPTLSACACDGAVEEAYWFQGCSGVSGAFAWESRNAASTTPAVRFAETYGAVIIDSFDTTAFASEAIRATSSNVRISGRLRTNHATYIDASTSSRIDVPNLYVDPTSGSYDPADYVADATSKIYTWDYINVNRDQASPGIFNRTTNDGSVISVRRDGTEVGFLGSRSGVVMNVILDPRSSAGQGAGIGATGEAVLPCDHASIADNHTALGASTHRWTNTFSVNFRPGAGTATWTSGSGTPEGSVTAGVGSLYTRTDGGASTTLYVKESGSGNTGWVAK